MGNYENMQAAIAHQAAEFTRLPENLLLAIVYNNPEQVSDNLQSMMGVSYAQDAEQIMDWFEQYGGELDADMLYHILNVPFNPDAQNITADYWQVLRYQAMADYGDSESDPLRPWAETFPEAIERLYDKYFQGQESTGTLGSDIDASNKEKQQVKETIQRKTLRGRKRRKIAGMIFNAVVALSFLFFIISGIVMLAKSGKGGKAA